MTDRIVVTMLPRNDQFRKLEALRDAREAAERERQKEES